MKMDYFVASDGSKVSSPNHVARLVIVGRTRAADGMELFRVETFESDELGRLPEQKVLVEKTLGDGEEPGGAAGGTDYGAV